MNLVAIIAVILFCLGGCGEVTYDPKTGETDFEQYDNKVINPITRDEDGTR